MSIEVEGVARQITYNAFRALVQRVDERTIAIVMVDPHGDAHVFPMDVPNAKLVEDGLVQARTGVQVTGSMPNGDGARG